MVMPRCSRILRIIALLVAVCCCLGGCLEFESVEQPFSVLAGETLTVSVSVAVSGIAQPYCGIRLPVGWTIPGGAVSCTGVSNQTIYYDSDLSLEQEGLSPSPDGYYWWVGAGSAETTEDGLVVGLQQK